MPELTYVFYQTAAGGQIVDSTHPLPVTLTGSSTSTVDLTKVGGTAIALGQTTMAASLPIALASNQTAVPGNITQVGGSSLALGQAAMAASVPMVIASNQTAVPGNITQVGGSSLALGQTTMTASVPVVLASNQSVITTGGTTPYVTATMSRPAEGTQYAIGDIIANSGTGASVVPITFTVARISGGSGIISGAQCTVTAASGTIVLPAFDLLLFRPTTNIPFAAGSYPADNAALNVSSAAMIQLVAIFSFSSTGWRNQAGGATAAGANIYQAVALATRPYAPFNLAAIPATTVLGLLQAQNTWNPTAIVNAFDFTLNVSQD